MTFFKSIRGRITLPLMAAVTLAILIILAISTIRSEQMVTENRGELLNQLANNMALQLNKDMQSRGHEIQLLTGFADIKNPDIPLKQKLTIFENMRASYPNYAWIGMTDADGNILTGTDGLLVGKNVAKRDWFLEGAKGLHYGSVHDAFLLSKIMPKPKWDDLPLRLVDVSAPIHNEKGEFLGVVCGHLGWDWAFEMRHKMLASSNLQKVDLLVAKKDGSLLMGTSDLPSSSINLTQLNSFQQAFLNDHKALKEQWFDQIDYLSAASYKVSFENNMLQWVVVAREDMASVLTPVSQIWLNSTLMLLMVMLFLWWLVWRVVSKSTQALLDLTKAADGVRLGDKELIIPGYKRQDEVGVLSESITSLVNSLQLEIREKTEVAQLLQLMARVYDDSPLGVIITDKNKRIVDVNSAFTQVTGYSKQEAIGSTPSMLRSGRQKSDFYNEMRSQIEAEGRWQGEIWNRNKAGEIYPEWLIISSLKDTDDSVTHYIGIFADITDKKQAEKQLVFLANHDVLTELPNRRLLQDHVDYVINQTDGEAGLIFLDLDFFKSINDSLGHLVGDKLLRQVAKTLQNQFEAPNLVARFGGDEFVIFMPDITDKQALEQTANSLVKLFDMPYSVGDYSLQVGVTMGISLYPHDGDNAQSLIQAADTAMYTIKRDHVKSFQFYSDDMRTAAIEKLYFERDLKSALKNNEFYLVYQPQISNKNSQLIGLEALLRWKHPQKGVISPMVFIPVLEEMGLIDEVGLWVIEQALSQFKTWQESYHVLQEVSISINLSAIQVRNPKLTEMLIKRVAKSRVSLEQVTFEVTESVMLDDNVCIKRLFQQLQAEGCHFSLDDYGTGYSNLAYIDRLNLSELKIDRAFIQNIERSESDRLIVHHTIEMAEALGMRVVVEGVESPAQMTILQKYSNLVIQGYYFDKPLTVEEMCARLTDNKQLKWLKSGLSE